MSLHVCQWTTWYTMFTPMAYDSWKQIQPWHAKCNNYSVAACYQLSDRCTVASIFAPEYKWHVLQNWSRSPKLRELIIQVEVIVRVHILCSPSQLPQLRDTRKSSADLCPCKIYISYRPKLDELLGNCQLTFRLEFLSPQFCCQLVLLGLALRSFPLNLAWSGRV